LKAYKKIADLFILLLGPHRANLKSTAQLFCFVVGIDVFVVSFRGCLIFFLILCVLGGGSVWRSLAWVLASGVFGVFSNFLFLSQGIICFPFFVMCPPLSFYTFIRKVSTRNAGVFFKILSDKNSISGRFAFLEHKVNRLCIQVDSPFYGCASFLWFF